MILDDPWEDPLSCATSENCSRPRTCNRKTDVSLLLCQTARHKLVLYDGVRMDLMEPECARGHGYDLGSSRLAAPIWQGGTQSVKPGDEDNWYNT